MSQVTAVSFISHAARRDPPAEKVEGSSLVATKRAIAAGRPSTHAAASMCSHATAESAPATNNSLVTAKMSIARGSSVRIRESVRASTAQADSAEPESADAAGTEQPSETSIEPGAVSVQPPTFASIDEDKTQSEKDTGHHSEYEEDDSRPVLLELSLIHI